MGSVVKGITGGGGKDSAKAATNASQAASKGQIAAANTASQSQLAASQAASQNALAASQQASNATLQGSQTASNAYLQGSQTAAASQQQALDYLRQADQLPTGLRENALRSLGGLYGGSGSITDRAMASPLYQAAVQQGENSVLRNASATGGLRSGNASENLAQVNQNALIAAYNDQISGLQGLSSLQSNANNIAALQAGVGNTLGQGQSAAGNALAQGQSTAGNALAQGQLGAGNYLYQGANNAANTLYSGNVDAGNTAAQGAIAAANASAQGGQNGLNNLMGIGGMVMQGFSQFSDRRLKTNIELAGEENGIRKYKWTWNKLASRLGLRGKGCGVMADEVVRTHPEAVSIRDGFMFVDYQKLGVSHGL